MSSKLIRIGRADARRANGSVDDGRVADTHDRERAQIVDDEMNAFPLREDVVGIGSRGVAFNRCIRRR